jgi:hypothetical protein
LIERLYDDQLVEYIQVDRDGQRLHLPNLRCTRGHLDMRHSWQACAACLYACDHWACRRTCGDVVRDPDHACRH